MAIAPYRKFLVKHASDTQIDFFIETAEDLWGEEHEHALTRDNMFILIPAFVVGELTTAFEIGFLIYLPFIVVDLVVSNILLAMGMMMLSPMTISCLSSCSCSCFSTAGRDSFRVWCCPTSEREPCLKPRSSLTPHGPLLLVLMLSLPPILVAAVVGIVVGLIQALTQIQEQTISFAFKLASIVLVIFMVMGWIGSELLGYAAESFNRIERIP